MDGLEYDCCLLEWGYIYMYIYIYTLVLGSVYFLWFVTCNKSTEKASAQVYPLPSRRAVQPQESHIFWIFPEASKSHMLLVLIPAVGWEGDMNPKLRRSTGRWKRGTTGRLGSIKVESY